MVPGAHAHPGEPRNPVAGRQRIVPDQYRPLEALLELMVVARASRSERIPKKANATVFLEITAERALHVVPGFAE